MKKFYLISLLFTCLSFVAYTATLPTGFVEKRIASGLDPTGVMVMKDGRVLVTIKSGKILLIKNDVPVGTPLLTLSNVDNFAERGLFVVVEDPAFATNGYVYVYYTYKNPTTNVSNNRVSRFTVVGDVANVNTELVLINFNNLTAVGWHNGGGLVFGTDGKIYASTGENTNTAYAQSFTTLLGKIIRINSDGSIPTDNPFYSIATGQNRAIYALGLRNPFKMKIEPSTGKIYINEVGAGSWEEINEVKPGSNYGWPAIEGKITTQTPQANYQDPLYTYNHGNGSCSITGGGFYTPTNAQFPAQYTNKYFFMDYCAGWIRYVDPANNFALSNFATGVNRPLDLAVISTGSMYYLARGGIGGGSNEDNTSSTNGELWKIDYTGSGDVNIGVNPANKSVAVGAPVNFVVSATGQGPLSYQWYKNGNIIANATSALYEIAAAALADNGAKFSVVVSNATSTKTSTMATLSVFANTAPVATITSPLVTATYEAGTTLSFAGTGTDAEDGNLPASAFSWSIAFQHDTHFHPALDEVSGIKNGTFSIPDEGETSDTVWFRIFLTVTDALGTKHTVFRDVFPKKVKVTLQTVPSGLKLKLDGVSITTPYTFTGVVGIKRIIEADNIVKNPTDLYSFSKWSNNGQALQTILTPKTNTTYTATYLLSKSEKTLAVADAFVKGGTNLNTTFGTTEPTQLQVKTEGDEERIRRAYLRFNISNTAIVNGATLRLFGKRNTEANANVSVGVYGVQNQTWDENTITWANKPTAGVELLSVATVNALPTSAGEYYEWDVSDYVKTAKLANQTFVSFCMINTSITENYVFFNSKEAIENKPELVLTFPTNPVGVDDTSQTIEASSVYPNPVNNQLHVSGNAEIFDLIGNKIMEGTHELDVTSLRKGVYLVKVNGATHKIVKN